jgi:hypothetical protein
MFVDGHTVPRPRMVLLDDQLVDLASTICADDVEGYVQVMASDEAGNHVVVTRHGRVDIVMEVH